MRFGDANRAYNEVRPHRALGRRTPAEVYEAGIKAIPTGPMINVAGYRVRHDKVSKAGNVTIRYRSRLHHRSKRRPGRRNGTGSTLAGTAR